MNSISNNVFNDLKLHLKLVGHFGMGIGFLYPIVMWLFSDDKDSYTLFNLDHIILLIIYLISIIYIDIEKNKIVKKSFSLIYTFLKVILNSIIDLLAYTFILISFLKLLEIIKVFNMEMCFNVIIGFVAGILVLVLKHIFLKYQ